MNIGTLVGSFNHWIEGSAKFRESCHNMKWRTFPRPKQNFVEGTNNGLYQVYRWHRPCGCWAWPLVCRGPWCPGWWPRTRPSPPWPGSWCPACSRLTCSGYTIYKWSDSFQSVGEILHICNSRNFSSLNYFTRVSSQNLNSCLDGFFMIGRGRDSMILLCDSKASKWSTRHFISAVKLSIGFTIGFHNHGEDPY